MDKEKTQSDSFDKSRQCNKTPNATTNMKSPNAKKEKNSPKLTQYMKDISQDGSQQGS